MSLDLSAAKAYRASYSVRAVPMTRVEYNDFRGWLVPHQENPQDKGFLVIREDQPSNVEGVNGYVSWLPEGVFNDTYQQTNTYVDRLIIEHDELEERLGKLKDFLPNADEATREVLSRQAVAMEGYLSILKERLSLVA